MPEPAPLRRRVADAIDGATDPRTVWRRLGEAGVIAELRPAECPQGLDDLLAELDARLPLGVVLSVCVQVALALPLLRTIVDSATVDGGAVDGDRLVRRSQVAY